MEVLSCVRADESAYCIRIRKKFEHVRRIQMESQRHPTTGVLIVGKQVFEKGRRRFSGSFPGSGQTEAYRRAFLGIIVESITAMTSIAVCPCPVVRTEQTDG